MDVTYFASYREDTRGVTSRAKERGKFDCRSLVSDRASSRPKLRTNSVIRGPITSLTSRRWQTCSSLLSTLLGSSSEVSLARIWGLGARRVGKFTVSVSILPQSRADDGADRYGQTSLLVGYRSGAKRRWIEAGRGSASGYFVRRRYSAGGVDSCRIVYLVGQPTMSPAAKALKMWAVIGLAVVAVIS